MRQFVLFTLAFVIATTAVGCAGPTESERQFAEVHDTYLMKYRPLAIEAERAWWNAATTGSDDAFKRKAEWDEKLVELHGDKAVFAKLKALKESGGVKDRVLARELNVMYRAHLPGQADPELQKRIITAQTEVEKIFTNHRSEVDDRELSENDVRNILDSTTDSASAEAAWIGYMGVGVKAADQLRNVAKLRNELARKLGYRDFYVMQLALQEIDENQLLLIFEELDSLTREPFKQLKDEIDLKRAGHFGIAVADLKPWHYGDIFFQEAPPLDGPDLNQIYAKQDLLALTKTYYKGMGFEVDDILKRSDLYERPGKNSHAFATHIDREGDTRVLCNLQPNLRWMDTLLHELGHAVYDKYIDRSLPFLLRTPSHSITTEGYAMMIGAMAKNREFMEKVIKMSPGEAEPFATAARRSLRAEKLIFSRWAQVMMRFERAMYANPDQNLSKIWWDLKKEYQFINPPDDLALPGYAAKIHILTNPVYYHSYLMGDLFASQVHNHIARKIIGTKDPRSTCYFGSTNAGDYMTREIFLPGNLYSWNALTRRATGEPLTAKYFVQLYVDQ